MNFELLAHAFGQSDFFLICVLFNTQSSFLTFLIVCHFQWVVCMSALQPKSGKGFSFKTINISTGVKKTKADLSEIIHNRLQVHCILQKNPPTFCAWYQRGIDISHAS